MKFSSRAVSSIVAATVVTLLPTKTSAAPIETCSQQLGCLDFTFKSIPKALCSTNKSPCEYKVCMTLNFDKPDCIKDSGTVSHTCEKPDNQCSPNPGVFLGVSTEKKKLEDEYCHCQIVPAGGVAEFLLKDGNANPHCGVIASTAIPYTGGSAQCATFPLQSCTGDGNIGNECAWKITAPSECESQGGGGGEPHINLWNSTQFDYHGECDLVVLDNKDFHNGLGMDIHMRTTQEPFGYTDIPEFYYSFIESAAIRIGDDVLEFTGDDFFINGVKGSDSDLPATIGDGFRLRYPTYKEESMAKHYLIDLNDGDYILFYKYMHFMSLVINGKPKDFGNSVGIMGDFHTSEMLARDGKTILHDANEFGSEWQVHENEPKLFRTLREPQHPHAACKVPENTIVNAARRHLRKDEAFLKAAEEACAHKSNHGFESCVFDVLATKDFGMAHAWGL